MAEIAARGEDCLFGIGSTEVCNVITAIATKTKPIPCCMIFCLQSGDKAKIASGSMARHDLNCNLEFMGTLAYILIGSTDGKNQKARQSAQQVTSQADPNPRSAISIDSDAYE